MDSSAFPSAKVNSLGSKTSRKKQGKKAKQQQIVSLINSMDNLSLQQPINTSCISSSMYPTDRVYCPQGITNNNLFCALNSVIQGLMVMPFLTSYLESWESMGDNRPITRALRSFLQRIWKHGQQFGTPNEAIDPIMMEDAYPLLFNSRFSNSQQHDADEYFNYVIDQLHCENLSCTGSSPIHDILQGSYASGENFTSLILDIMGDGIHSVNTALSRHLNPVNGDVNPRRFQQLPPIMCVVLNRTHFNEMTFQVERIQKKIVFKPNLFIKPSMMASEGHPETQYSLMAVIKHSGSSSDFGHYIAYVNSPQSGSWHMMNDHMEDQINLSEVLLDSSILSSFMLFYRRLDEVQEGSKQNNRRNKKNRY